MGVWDTLEKWLIEKNPEDGASIEKDLQNARMASQSFDAGQSIAKDLASTTGGRTPSKRGSKELIQAYSDLPSVRVVVQRIAEAVASLHWQAYTVKGQRLKRSLVDCSYTSWRTQKEETELIPVPFDPLLDAWNSGNAILNGFQCREVLQTHFELVGESVFRKQMGGLNTPVAIWPLNPTWVESLPSLGKPYYRVKVGAVPTTIPEDEIVFLRNPDPVNPYQRGSGTGYSLRDELDTDEYMAAYIRSFFANSATPAGFVTIDGAGKEDVERFARMIDNQHRGSDRAHRLHFLNHEVQTELFGSSFSDMQIAELRGANKNYIREIFGIPPEIVGVLENSNRATIDAAEYIFARWTVIPRAERWRRELQHEQDLLKTGRAIFYDDPLPDNRDFALSVATVSPWSRTRAEWRQLQGLDSTDDDNVYVIPQGLQEIAVGEKIPDPGMGTLSIDSVETRESVETLKTRKRRLEGIFTHNEVDDLVSKMPVEKIRESLESIWGKELDAFARESFELQFGLDIGSIRNNPLFKAHMQEFGSERISKVADTTRDMARDSLIKSIEEGDGITQARKRLEEKLDVSRGRAERIARTEMNRSANFANMASNKASGLVNKHKWVAHPGATTRRHFLSNVDGQIRPIGEDFNVRGSFGPYPGATGDPGEDINCRCSTVPMLDDEFMKDLDEQLKQLQIEENLAAGLNADGSKPKPKPKGKETAKDQKPDEAKKKPQSDTEKKPKQKGPTENKYFGNSKALKIVQDMTKEEREKMKKKLEKLHKEGKGNKPVSDKYRKEFHNARDSLTNHWFAGALRQLFFSFEDIIQITLELYDRSVSQKGADLDDDDED